MGKTYTPQHDFVLIQPDKVGEKTSGGVLMPESRAKESLPTGVVIAAGPGIEAEGKRSVPDVVAGDRVMVSQWTGAKVEVNGKECVFVPWGYIISTIHG